MTARRPEPAAPAAASAAEPPVEAFESAAPLMTPETTLPLVSGLSADMSLAMPEYDGSRPPTREEIERIRRIRRPMGSFSQKLELPARAGYYRHWFNDLPGRVDQANASGWEFVRDKDGQPRKMVVGRAGQGGGQMAFAMEIPMVFWQEDMAAKHTDAQSRMEALKASPFQAKPGTADKSDAQKFYTPKEATNGPLDIRGPGQ